MKRFLRLLQIYQFYFKDEVTAQRIELLTSCRGKIHSLTVKQHKQTLAHQNMQVK